jgi:tetratricopeptide (TPR) repeat protein
MNLQEQAKLAEAEQLFRRILAMNEAALGPHHPDVASSVNNLAYLLEARGMLDEAEPLFRRALRVCEAALAPDHPTSPPASTTLRRCSPSAASWTRRSRCTGARWR